MTGDLRCLSVLQPWAQAIALGYKPVENRSWTTPYRGVLAIHASKGYDDDAQGDWRLDADGAPPDGPRGAVVALCTLAGVHPATAEGHWLTACCPPYGSPSVILDRPYHWVLKNVLRLPTPIPARGMPGLWEPSDELRAQIEAVVPS